MHPFWAPVRSAAHINSIYSTEDVNFVYKFMDEKQKYLFYNNNTIIFYDHQTITLPLLMTQHTKYESSETPDNEEDDD